MSSTPEDGFEEALAPILALVSPPGPRGDLVEAFARAVLRRVPTRELEDADALPTAVALVDAFDFVDARPPGEIRVRLVDPRVTIDGWHSTGTVVQVSCADRQFIVTTVKEELHRLGHKVTRILHPVFGSERGADGRLAAIVAARDAEHRESFLQAELGGRVAPDARQALVAGVQAVLDDVFAATGDFLAMRDQVMRSAAGLRGHAALRYPADEVAEGADLLDWLLDDNFVLEGTCRLVPDDSGPGGEGTRVVDALGILSDPDAPLRPNSEGDDAGVDQGPVSIVRTSEVSTVHRQVPMHRIDVVEVGPDGQVAGAFRLVGVFSRKAAAEPAIDIPVLRFKLRRILELEDLVEGGHDEAMIVSLFQVLPKEELFEADVASLRQVVVGLAAAEQRSDVQVVLHVEPADHTVSALLSIPQELYSTALRQRIERFLLAQLDGSRVDANVSLGEGADVIVRLVVQVDGPLPEPPLDDIEREVRLLCRTWDEELTEALIERVGEGRGTRLAHAWADWFPTAYRGAVPAAGAVDDVLQLDGLGTAGRDIAVVLVPSPARPSPASNSHARLKVFSRGRAVELSRFLPIVESLGLWAVEEVPYTLGAGDGDSTQNETRNETHNETHRAHLHDFAVTDPTGRAVDVERDGPRLADAAQAMWDGRAEVDSLNRLVLRGGLTWDDVAVLRAYRRYRSQVGTTFTTEYVDDVLVENAGIACTIVELFAARFDPVRAAGTSLADELRRRIIDGCDAVPRLDHDRILRGFLALVDATLRTNRYLHVGDGPGHLALKFDSGAVPDMPRPVPYREIFVHGPAVEGIHLRWGPVARGGIRWSERPDDYRSEVLGLMRAQVLKNAVIVPTGAKGGFVVRRGRYGGAETDVRRAYEVFVTSLLEVTDNVVGDRVVPVPRRRDGDDPYLVVAADRGTATFSDLANRLSDEHGFWLGDAFASGGSRGYDHKKLGITARGAWVAVRHHFAELDIDIGDGDIDDEDAEPITVAGIGDMSGDVFGNGMLRSDRIRLVAAFDHRDIFLDPDPDPARSYEERARLFALPQSSWQDYDRGLVSPGGGVWSRLDKRIRISSEVRAVLRLDGAVEHLSPPELIRAILQAPVALLFAGGIGTFVRAADEPDREIDDRANAEVRVTGSQVRARVVGEGANLAFTQRARIEYARRGGHINTDAIDNSAGVDISDREVNLKILLRPAVESGAITLEERDGLLTDVCADVVAAVLHDSARQSLALSRSQAASAGRMGAIERLMVELETAGVLDRAVEALPATAEMGARVRAGAGMSRPELAVLMAGAKRSLAAQLLASEVPDQPALRAALKSYFPALLADRLVDRADRLPGGFDRLLDGHRLRRELIASVVANEVVDRMGVTFASRLAADTGADPAAVASAWWVARDVVGATAWWRELDGTDDRPRPVVPEQVTTARAVLEALTRDYLRRGDARDIAAGVARDRPAASALGSALPRISTDLRRRRRARRAEALVDGGLEPEAAARWAALGELEIVADVAEVARRTKRSVTGVARALVEVEEALGIDQLVERLRSAVVDHDDRWSRAAVRGLLDDLDDLRRAGAVRALELSPEADESEAVARFLAARSSRSAEITALLRGIDAEPTVRLDALAVTTRAVRQAID